MSALLSLSGNKRTLDQAGKEDHKHRGTVAGIGKAVVQPASFATQTQAEESLKQPPLAAARTAARESGADRRKRRMNGVGHETLLAFQGG